MKFALNSIIAGLSVLFAGMSYACNSGQDDCVEVGKWDVSLGIGAGVRTSPVEDGDNFPLVLLPQINYNGERFFIQNLDFGFILWESETQQLNLFATASYDQVFFDRWNPTNFFTDTNALMTSVAKEREVENSFIPQIETDTELVTPGFTPLAERKLRNRRAAGLAGFEYQFSLDAYDFQFQYLSEFTGLHNGEEARVSIARHWVKGKHQFIGSLGAVWQGSEVLNYYYGVTQPEADARGIYTADAAVSGILRVDWNYQLTSSWDLRMFASYRHLPDEITASPLVNENKVITVFIGGVYHF